jgi:hypothetical protein
MIYKRNPSILQDEKQPVTYSRFLGENKIAFYNNLLVKF